MPPRARDAGRRARRRPALERVLEADRRDGVSFHAIRTRVRPGARSVDEAHALADRLERGLESALPGAAVTTQLEPVEDPASPADLDLERTEP